MLPSDAALTPLLSAEPSEAAVLGLILLDGRKFVDAAAHLSAKNFAFVRNGELFDIMAGLNKQGKTPDLITVDTALRVKYNGKADEYLQYIAMRVLPNAIGDIEQHARTVVDFAYRRQLADAADKIRALALTARELDSNLLATQAQNLLTEIGAASGTHDPVPISVAMSEHWDEIERTQNLEGVSGLATGFVDIDDVLDGYQGASVNVVAARPGMGKTSFALGASLNVAQRDGVVYHWLGEQTRREASMSLTAMMTGIDTRKLRRGLRQGGMSQDEYRTYTETASRVSRLPIYLDDQGSMTVMQLVARATKITRRKPLSLIVVDYGQLLTYDGRRGGSNDNERYTEISRLIKTELAPIAPVLLVLQLNREVEGRNDKRPTLSDLRGSGAWEQDAASVMFLYRDAYYNPMAADPHCAEALIAKNRYGEFPKTLNLHWTPHCTRFANWKSQTISMAVKP